MFAEERKIKIAELIHKKKKATVSELCEAFNVSCATVRNDLRELEQSGLIIRTHGGALVKSKTGFELTAKQKSVQGSESKRVIAELAIELIEDGDTLIIDTGTTTAELSRLLYRKKGLTVVTNDLIIARILEEFETVNTIFLGGQVRRGFHCTIGVNGIEMLSGLSVDKAFIGANSFSAEQGAATPDIHQASSKRSMVQAASEVILLCEGAKYGSSSFAMFAQPTQIDIFVTDHLAGDGRMQLEELGVRVIMAGYTAKGGK